MDKSNKLEELHAQLHKAKHQVKIAYSKLKHGESLSKLKPLTDKHDKIHQQIKKLK